jgi:16S rRNA (cytosine967-C5)-methyltransferase
MTDARHTAVAVLNTVDQRKKTLDRVLRALPQDEDYLSRRDRALLNAMVYGVLRWRGRLDHIIAYFSNIPLRKIQPMVLNILRLGLFQIIFLDRVPNSAAVNTSVELAKQMNSSRASGFVNALLRKAADNWERVPFSTFQEDPLAFLTTDQSIPKWLASRWLKRFSAETISTLVSAANAIPPITLRTNTLKTNRAQLIRSLEDQTEHSEPTSYAPDGVKMMNPKQSIPHLAAYKKGWFQVQDEAAQLVALLLDPQPGESVLDACAGLGGKTAHMAQLMQNQGIIAALDSNAEKLKQLGDEMPRLGVTMVQTVCQDLMIPFDRSGHEPFDRILLDAPCTGLGVIRRNPDIKWHTSVAQLTRQSRVQKQILGNLADWIKPGGILVYAVCSMEPEENEVIIDDFLKKRPDFVIDKNWGKLPEAIRSGAKSTVGYTTLKFIKYMDGFYFARLKRKQ